VQQCIGCFAWYTASAYLMVELVVLMPCWHYCFLGYVSFLGTLSNTICTIGCLNKLLNILTYTCWLSFLMTHRYCSSILKIVAKTWHAIIGDQYVMHAWCLNIEGTSLIFKCMMVLWLSLYRSDIESTEIGGYPLPMVLLEICSLCEEQIFLVFTIARAFNI